MTEEPTVKESLQAIEKTCAMDVKCDQTAVTYVDGVAACEYHSGEML
jgi:copper chaperone CopZ